MFHLCNWGFALLSQSSAIQHQCHLWYSVSWVKRVGFECYHAGYWKLAIDLVLSWVFFFFFSSVFHSEGFWFWNINTWRSFLLLFQRKRNGEKVFVIFVHINICDWWMERELFSHGKLEMKWLFEKFCYIKRKRFVRLVLTSYTKYLCRFKLVLM